MTDQEPTSEALKEAAVNQAFTGLALLIFDLGYAKGHADGIASKEKES